MEKYELPVPPVLPAEPSHSDEKLIKRIDLDTLFDRTFLKPLFLNVPCPSCGQRFRLDIRELDGVSSHFVCNSCRGAFELELPIRDPNRIRCRRVRDEVDIAETRARAAALSKAALSKPGGRKLIDARKCPKCDFLNLRTHNECLSCGVLFRRLHGIPAGSQVKATPSLVKAWSDLMGDYQNLRKHFEFVDRCEDLNAVPFALKKYEDFKSVQPEDPIAKNMIQRVIMKQFSRMDESHRNTFQAILAWPWIRIAKMAPLGLSALLVLLGVVFPSLRNLVGVGAGVAIVSIGFVMFTHGRLNPQDFWKNE